MAPPVWRVVSFMAEPTPAFSRGSEPMIESVAGAMTLPMPTAMTHGDGDDLPQRGVRRQQGERGQRQGDDEQAEADDQLVAEPLHQAGRRRSATIISTAAWGMRRAPALSGL